MTRHWTDEDVPAAQLPDNPLAALAELPVFGVCGRSGSGKTTLIEQVVQPLVGEGLHVGVVKNAGRIDLDRRGSDSDRLFAAGADVVVTAGDESLRRGRRGADADWAEAIRPLAETCDLVLVEGRKHSPLPKIWLLREGEQGPPADVENVRAVLAWDADRPAALLRILKDFTRDRWMAAPVYGCVLIGGRSRRMGTPKHLLTGGGRSWLARTAGLLGESCRRVVVAGAGEMPPDAGEPVRLPDAPDAAGPLAGLLAAMRWAPRACWLAAACDMPALTGDALKWLLSHRRVGTWAVLPRLDGADHVEPLLAFYDFRCRRHLEQMARAGDFRLNHLAGRHRVASPTPPPELAGAWRNVNTPGELG